MTQDELIELRENIAKLNRLVGDVFMFEAETGRLHYESPKNGVFDFETLLKDNTADGFEEVGPLVREINEIMEQYVRDYGKLPPELYTH